MIYQIYIPFLFLAFQSLPFHSNALDPHKILEANKNTKKHDNGLIELDASHKYLNSVLRWRKEDHPQELEYEYSQLPLGYNNREKFRKLIQQRDGHENKIDPLIKAGKIWHKENKTLSHIFLQNAYGHRLSSQKIQHKINHVRKNAQLHPYFRDLRAGTSSGNAQRK